MFCVGNDEINAVSMVTSCRDGFQPVRDQRIISKENRRFGAYILIIYGSSPRDYQIAYIFLQLMNQCRLVKKFLRYTTAGDFSTHYCPKAQITSMNVVP